MKKGDKISGIEELFREKLESVEVTPSDGLYGSISSRVAFREFFRFNPRRINIWYTAAAATLAITTSLLFNSPEGPDKPSIDNVVADSSKVEGAIENNSAPPAKESEESGKKETARIKRRPLSGTSRNSDGFTDTLFSSPNSRGNEVSETLKAKELSVIKSGSETKFRESAITVVRISASVLSGCEPLSVQFTNNSLNYDSCRWTFGDGGSSTTDNPVWLFDEAGDYTVSLAVFGTDGRMAQTQLKVRVFQKPTARFEISEAKLNNPAEGVRLSNLSTGAVRYNWSFGDGNSSELIEPIHKYQKSGDYTISLHAVSAEGCLDSMVLRESIAGTGYFIEFPNAVLANADGPTGGYYSVSSDQTSSVFHPVASGVADYNLKVYSKRGVLIFETNDMNIGWDGYYKGQLCEPGVYIWKVRGRYRNGELFVKMGDVTLFRK